MAEAIVITAAALVGYILGRTRPLRRAQRAIDWRLIAPDPARPLGYRDALAFAILRPGRALHAWRHRHDPPPRKIPTSEIFGGMPQSGGGEQRG